ncbi:hypothetical protein MRX96_028594 [Rhipicephalus microplus]
MGNALSLPTLRKSTARIRVKMNANIGANIGKRKTYTAAATCDNPLLADLAFINFSSDHERREDYKTVHVGNWAELFPIFTPIAENERSEVFDERKQHRSNGRFALLVLTDYRKPPNRRPCLNVSPFFASYSPALGYLHDNGLFHI